MTEIAETPRLRLRTWTLDDLAAGLRLWGDPEVMRFVDGGRPESEEEVRRSIMAGIAHQERHGCQHWAVVERSSGEVVGCAGFNLFEGGPDLELVVHLARDRWGCGFATEACRAALAVIRSRPETRRVVAGVHPENHGSRRLLEKLGFSLRGTHVFEAGGDPEPFFVLDPGVAEA